MAKNEAMEKHEEFKAEFKKRVKEKEQVKCFTEAL